MPGAGTSNPEPEVQVPMAADPIDVEPPHVHTGEAESDREDPVDSDGGSSGSCNDEFVGNTLVGEEVRWATCVPGTKDVH
ncbi:hypothetical protein PIB30_016432 [Stylosanthes scabra]|uniref:Uncharacterized protein n=1 Tax=Stylosanthes scabra TaxID=79078 RepID=A0ABU6W6X2_9FABA|nr:hypothetical protein [Stylosanthes scabra]